MWGLLFALCLATPTSTAARPHILRLCLALLLGGLGRVNSASRCTNTTLKYNFYYNIKTEAAPAVANHPSRRADIVIATDADFGEQAELRDGVLRGFDVELTEAVCAAAGRTCALVTVPFAAIWPVEYARFGWLLNDKTYPGEGYHARWFHCAVGLHNTVARQQSVAFTHPYTDGGSEAGFVAANASAAVFPADAAGRVVGLVDGWATSAYFRAEVGRRFRPGAVVGFPRAVGAFAALVAGDFDAMYIDRMAAQAFLDGDGGEAFRFLHAASGWSRGVAYGCHPEYGDAVTALNRGLAVFKAADGFADLCARYPTVDCDFAGTTFHNVKTDAHPEIADHPVRRADIVLATQADWGDHNYIRQGVLGGFDIELTKVIVLPVAKAIIDPNRMKCILVFNHNVMRFSKHI